MQDKALDILSQEHQLILRMISKVGAELERMDSERVYNEGFIDWVIEFIISFTDGIHHGKEGIFFDKIRDRDLSFNDKVVLSNLGRDHLFLKESVLKLDAAHKIYRESSQDLGQVLKHLRVVSDDYVSHVSLEERDFFPSAIRYLDEAERYSLWIDFLKFDRKKLMKDYMVGVE